MWETWLWSLGGEDLLEKGIATHSSTLAWRIPYLEEPDWLQSMDSQRVGHCWVTILLSHLSFVNPLYFFFNLFFILFFMSWRLITLQYCSGFCHTLKWISHGFTCVPPPNPPSHLPLHPIPWVLPVYQRWALVSCIQPGLVIYFTLDNIHVSMLFSWNIPPSPSPTETKSTTIKKKEKKKRKKKFQVCLDKWNLDI